MKYPRPRLMAEQNEIIETLRVIDAKISHHESRQKLLQRLLHDLMTGRRRVRDLDLEKVLGEEVAS